MEKIITSNSTGYKLSILWKYRELIYFLSLRDIKIRYKQTIIGIFWIILQPFLTMIVLNIIFGEMTKSINTVPYPLFVYSGLIFWNFFSKSMVSIADSLTSNRDIITKVYIPKLVFPLSAIVVNLVDFIVSLSILFILMIYYQIFPTVISFIIFPVCLLLIIFFCLGIGAILAALNLIYRDIRFIIPFFLQIFLFLTPVIYPINFVSENYQIILNLNPFTIIIETLRSSLFSNTIQFQPINFLFIFGISLIILIIGLYVFMKLEPRFCDVV